MLLFVDSFEFPVWKPERPSRLRFTAFTVREANKASRGNMTLPKLIEKGCRGSWLIYSFMVLPPIQNSDRVWLCRPTRVFRNLRFGQPLIGHSISQFHSSVVNLSALEPPDDSTASQVITTGHPQSTHDASTGVLLPIFRGISTLLRLNYLTMMLPFRRSVCVAGGRQQMTTLEYWPPIFQLSTRTHGMERQCSSLYASAI